MKKKILLWVLCAAIFSAMLGMGAAAFADIDDETTEDAVAALESMGIVTGTSATTYSPSLSLTRAQVCAMMVRTLGMESSVNSYMYQSLFQDVKSSSWYAGYVNLAYREGLVSGYGNGCFGPDDEMTYGQFVTMLLRLLGYTENDIGKLWPADHIIFADKLGIDENVSLTANDTVTRGDAAVLLYNTLMTKAKGSGTAYYHTVNDTAATVTAILLDNKVTSATTGDLLACVMNNSNATMTYYDQKNAIPDTLVGRFGTLMLNGSGEVVGFIPDGNDYADIVIDSAKISGITDMHGNTYKIDGAVGVISSGSICTYSSTGYVKVNAHHNQSARFYYGDDGSIVYIFLTSGADLSSTEVAVASSDAPASEFAQTLGISANAYHIVKNGGLTDTAALAMYDVAYYDKMTNTLRVCDYKVTGYIESASPSVSAAEKITISGCEIGVLQCAWDTLGDFRLGSYVTVLLTDTGKVAAAYSADTVTAEMYGILSTDKTTVTLCGSGLVMKPDYISASLALNGSLVKVNTSDTDRISCSSLIRSVTMDDTVDLTAMTVGGVALAPGCLIYEWGGSGYVYSLSGEYGKSSSDLSEIYWTDTLAYSYVSFYHLNSAGLIDILVLSDVTGNYYAYGDVTVYTDEEGISMSQQASVYLNGATITNDNYPNASKRYICTVTNYGGYMGVAFGGYNQNYTKIAAVSRPTLAKNAKASDFYLTDDDEWYFTVNDSNIPVSDTVKVYIEATGQWLSGEEGLLAALSSEMKTEVYYDRTLTTGAQVRIIVVDADE